MKLSSLEPRFLVVEQGGFKRMQASSAGAQGIMFQCPAPSHMHAVIVWFQNPIDNYVAPPRMEPHQRWRREGISVDALSLYPSVNVPGCWHGRVFQGEVY